jgi:drug/metabolite transporter (DMT)-like permease
LGCALASLAMLLFSAGMLWISLVRGFGSGPGSIVAAMASVPAGVLCVALQLSFGADVQPPSLRAVLMFIVAGIFSTYLGRWLVFRSIETIGPSRAAGVQSVSPLITALFGWIFLAETLSGAGIFGIALGIAGLGAISVGVAPASGAGGMTRTARQNGFVFGSMLFGLGAAAAYSGSNVFRASAVREWDEPLLGTMLGALAGLGALLLAGRNQLAAYVREIRAQPVGAWTYFAVGALQFVGQVLVIASMKYIPAGLAALISMCTPLVVMPISYFVLRKQEICPAQPFLGSASPWPALRWCCCMAAPPCDYRQLPPHL